MEEREPVMVKRVVRLPDGRRLVFYEFPDAPAPPKVAEGPERARRSEGEER